jgi:putative transposase
MGISEATFCLWKKHQKLGPSEPLRLRQLEEGSCKLKQIVADQSLDKAMLGRSLQERLEAFAQA